ncbi:hypothetical protein EIN_249850, partial [Entamoeba invadens IP1]
MINVVLPNNPLEEFGEGAFSISPTIKSVVLGGTTKLPKDTFKNCAAIDAVNGLDRIISFGESCFKGTSITNFIFNDNVEMIGSRAFALTKISNMKLPESPVTELGNAIFEKCTSLFHIDFGGSTIIPQNTFS